MQASDSFEDLLTTWQSIAEDAEDLQSSSTPLREPQILQTVQNISVQHAPTNIPFTKHTYIWLVYTKLTIKYALLIITDLKVRQVPILDLRVSNWHMCWPRDFFVDNNDKKHNVCALKVQHFSSNTKNLKGKFVPVNAMKAQLQSFQTSELGGGVWLTSRPVTLPRGKKPRCPLNRRFSAPLIRPRRFEEDKSLDLPGIEPQIAQPTP